MDTESQLDGHSVLSFLGDFGVGNVLEKNSALKSGNNRSANLKFLRNQRCGILENIVASSYANQPSVLITPLSVGEKGGELSQVA